MGVVAGSMICVMWVAEGDPAERCRSGAIEDSYKAKGPRSEVPQRGCPIVVILIHVSININVYTWQ